MDHHLIRTTRKAELRRQGPTTERGVRYFRTVELLARDWFVVDVAFNGPDGLERRSWLTMSLHEAAHLAELDGWQSSRISAHLASRESDDGYVHSVLKSAHESHDGAVRLYQFDFGLMVTLGKTVVEVPAYPTESLMLVYPRRPRRALQSSEREVSQRSGTDDAGQA